MNYIKTKYEWDTYRCVHVFYYVDNVRVATVILARVSRVQWWICVDFQGFQGASPSQQRFLQFGQSKCFKGVSRVSRFCGHPECWHGGFSCDITESIKIRQMDNLRVIINSHLPSPNTTQQKTTKSQEKTLLTLLT